MKRRIVISLLSICMALSLVMAGCSSTASEKASTASSSVSAADTSASDSADTASTTTDGLMTPVSAIDTDDQFSDNDLDTGYDESNSTQITLSSTSASVSGSGATADGSTVTITEEGTYIISGTISDGQIIVNADDSAKVKIVLNGVTMTNDDSACILALSADKVFVTLADGTENTLSDTGAEYTQTDSDTSVDGVIYSKCDLTFNGSGTLTVNAGYKHGIVCNDDLVFTGGTYNITATGKGIKANDSIRIKNGTFNIDAQDDSIHTSNDEESGKGYIYICGGTFNLSSGDDGIHAATALLITGGDLTVTKSYEGLEGDSIDITDGDISVTSSDDGLNASSLSSSDETTSSDQAADASSADQQMQAPSDQAPSDQAAADSSASGSSSSGSDSQQGGFMGHGGPQGGGQMGGGMDDGTDANAYIRISGGTLYVNAEGDGIDSNGMLYVDGGTVTVDGPTEANNGALDYGTGAEITGGTVIAAGSSGMATSFEDSSTQYSILYNFDSTLDAGTEVTLTDADGNEVMSYTPAKSFSSVVFSSSELAAGDYTITAGDTTEKITVSSVATTAGTTSSMGGGKGGPGKMDGQGGPGQTQSAGTDSSTSDSASASSSAG